MPRLLFLSLLLAVAACTPGRDDPSPEPDDASVESVGVNFDGEAPPGAEQIVITTTGGEADLGLTDRVLFFRLSEKKQAEVESDMASETEDLDGLGGSIARAVTGAVADALDFTVRVPLDDVETVRYEDGRLQIETRGDTSFDFDHGNGDGSLDRQFDPEDARRFVETFERLTADR